MAAWVPAALTVASTLMSVSGKRKAAAASKQNARAAAEAKAFESAQLRQQAGQDIAVSQQRAQEQLRQSRLVQSRTLAVAAASGGGVSDPTIVRMLSRVAGEGTYRANTALYEGEERARLKRMQAEASDYEGKTGIISGDMRAKAYNTSAAASLFAGASSLYSKYNSGITGGGSGGGIASVPDLTGAGDLPVIG